MTDSNPPNLPARVLMDIVAKIGRRIWPIARKQVNERMARLEAHVLALDRNQQSQLQMQQNQFQQLQSQFQQQSHLLATFADRQPAEFARLWERMEFVRREILYEMKYAGTRTAQPTPARIVAPDKLALAQSQGLRLNLGCGHIPLPDYINADQREVPGVDIISDIANLPIPSGSAQEVFSSHLLEHFPQEELRKKLLPYWKSLLAKGGLFRAVAPDGEAMLASFAAGQYSFEEFREVLFGAQEYDGDFHFNFFTPASLRALLDEAGFEDISVPVAGRRNGKCFEFEIRARRP